MISFSYLSDLFETPTFERRKLLFSTKSFLCECPRCRGPDYCRCVRCPSCQTHVIPCRYRREKTAVTGKAATVSTGMPYWDCPSCGSAGDDSNVIDGTNNLDIVILRTERELETIIRVVERTILTKSAFKNQKETNTTPSLLSELIQECSSLNSSRTI